MEIVNQHVQGLSDQEIIQRILKGEIAAFEVLIRRNNSALYKVGRSYGFNHQDTEDLMQETFINAYLKLQDFEHRSSFKTWLIRIMINASHKKAKKFSYRFEKSVESINSDNMVPMYANAGNMDTGKKIINKELNNIMESAIAEIPVDYRMVFSLREINGLSVIETAEALEISEANVKTRLNRAKLMLRKKMEAVYSPEDLFEFNLVYCDRMVKRIMTIVQDLQ